MHSLLFVDTETNCFAEEIGADTWKRPHYEDDGSVIYPRISQISWIITKTDGEVRVSRDFIIKPNGYEISANATSVHGITNEYANEVGVPIEKVISLLIKDFIEYNCYKICGHNVKFDIHMIEAEALRLKLIGFYHKLVESHFEDTCTNSKVMHYVGGLDKRGRIKKPRLSELYMKIFGKEFEGAHNSMADITATKECYFELVTMGLIDQMVID